LFADDTSVSFSAPTFTELEEVINSELIVVSDWLLANRLSVNVGKSNFVVFKQKKKTQINVTLNGMTLEKKDTVKYLGILLDSQLSWQPQVSQVKRNISYGLGSLYKLRHFVPKKSLPNLYYSFIYSHISYGIEAWGAANDSILSSISVVMNKALRAIQFKGKREPVASLYTNQFLNLSSLIQFSWMKIIFKYFLGHFPEHFRSFFKILNHTHQTRFRDNVNTIVLPRFSSKLTMRSIFFKGIQMWNNLDTSYRKNTNFFSFKKELKKHLLDLQCSF